MRLRTVGEHGPNLAFARARGFKNQMAAIGRPTGTLVAALIAGQFENLHGSGIYDVEIVVIVRASPTESQQLAVGRPGWVDDIALVRHIEFRHTGTIGIH